MSYLVLARKWRPQSFEDLIGQEHVSRTISNAIDSGRVAHAFLFTGVRGVGKTTSARILAKALNCEKGPTAKPCLQCRACVEIAASTDMDVQEIDGASYNGVDEVRRLQENLPYRPSRDRFKIVIVDEVHMLSQSAWNAFLKTLEEPPPHVKFIFATTESHKVPITILSRCQRYDFKLISAQEIIKRLRYVLEQEKIIADEASLSLVAREAAGSMRDAMSLLDQAIAWGGDKLVGEDIARVLGVASRSTLQDLVSSLVKGDPEGCLHVIERLADQGFDMISVSRDILENLRDVVVAKICKDPGNLLDLTEEETTSVRALVSDANADDLLRLHLGFSRGFDQVAMAPQQRAALEMLLVRLARRPPLVPVDDLVNRLGQLERRLRSGSGTAGGSSPSRPPVPRGVASSGGEGPSHISRAIASQPAPVSHRSGGAAAAVSIGEPSVQAPRAVLHAVQTPLDKEEPQPAPDPVVSVVPDDEQRGLVERFSAIVEAVRKEDVRLGSVLEHAVPICVGPDGVTIGFEAGSFLADQIKEGQSFDLLTRVVRRHFGAPTDVSIALNQAQAKPMATVYDVEEAARKQRAEKTRAELLGHPLIRAAVEGLGARIQQVKMPPER